GGPAGMAAALEAEKNGVTKILILERDVTLGGILNQCIHTGFGLHYFKEELSGPEYAGRFIELVEASKCIKVKLDTMVLDVQAGEGFHGVVAVNKTDGLLELKAKAVVLAMGCRERPRGALNIAGTRPSGILSAGTAQKYVNMDGWMPGKEAVILGSGDIGLIMARRMTFEGAKVKMVCELMPYSGGLTRNIVQCLDDFDIPLRLSCTVIDVHGKERLEGVTVAYVDENRRPIPGTQEYVPCDLLLLSVGLIPENELTRGAGISIDMITAGAIVNETRETEVPGIFSCGNVLHVHDLVDYVTLESQLAGAGAARYIQGNTDPDPDYVNTKAVNGVRYIVPQRVNRHVGEPVKLYFRVGDVHKNASVQLCAGDQVLAKRKRPRLAPSEMEEIAVKPEQLQALPAGAELIVEVIE
ncbi:MAG: NAD(P)/FAD-dependent oxidoreductase, partial [Firmicutes bacterium]|nr:NAD(P)/FAD-dependent oxidoreductase [Bacillota bacterium]